ncbi:GTP-binding protein-like protein 2 [Stipitochalara longipes BDJ]|nr:GTP-binding protein-like protein 2 [Stipitochalara longipes BDJ]
MASIFTFDPDPPRVSSPWLTPTDSPKPSTPQPGEGPVLSGATPASGQLQDYGVTRLEAEPQDGPTEYKLHLLLRPRRAYSSSSTGSLKSESQQHKQPSNHLSVLDSGPILAASNQSRQHRLEQLTTQLLWRLQQSSPYHASSTSDLVLPKLPEAAESLETPSRPGKLLAGLEESRGALYEIGVSDDGTFVGLTKDEMDESLMNLRAMAASLGCNVEVVKMVVVGDCEWHESDAPALAISQFTKRRSRAANFLASQSESLRHHAQLWVAEALITPDLRSKKSPQVPEPNLPFHNETLSVAKNDDRSWQFISAAHKATEQLRITLTGPTTSGKSSLLGTLSTATLDNGRGKSRLSLLKHRHEIVSGVTSSVAQELIGYKDQEVINFASGNVTSWTDIHAAAENGRLVFVSDSAGHPRYRRTTVRGLVGWAPHSADDGENAPSAAGGTSSAQDILGSAGTGIDLAKAHLELCLKLDKPLCIVVTKLDLASKSSLRQTLSKILSAVKATGRTPSIIPPDQGKIIDSNLTTITGEEEDVIRGVVEKLEPFDLTSIVPIIMTSAAKGTGIRSLHALLKQLPIPPVPTSQDFVGLALNPEQPTCLFHIEDVFGLPASLEPLASSSGKQADTGVVVAGYLRFGSLAVGDIVVIGPFPAGWEENDSSPLNKFDSRSSPNSFGASLATDISRTVARNTVSASVTRGEWHSAHIAGQVGTVGVVFDIPKQELSNGPFEKVPLAVPRMRKGLVMAIPSRHMIVTGHSLQAASGFTASFEDSDINSVTPGSLVVVYIASIRASAKVLRLAPHVNNEKASRADELDDMFGLDSIDAERQEPELLIFGSDGVTDVTLELMTNREWIELGSQVLVMPGGGQGLYHGSERGEKGIAGLEGFVGRVLEVVD